MKPILSALVKYFHRTLYHFPYNIYHILPFTLAIYLIV